MRSKNPQKTDPEYIIWQNIKKKKLPMEPSWEDSYETFIKDVGRKPTPNSILKQKERGKGFYLYNVIWYDKNMDEPKDIKYKAPPYPENVTASQRMKILCEHLTKCGMPPPEREREVDYDLVLPTNFNLHMPIRLPRYWSDRHPDLKDHGKDVNKYNLSIRYEYPDVYYKDTEAYRISKLPLAERVALQIKGLHEHDGSVLDELVTRALSEFEQYKAWGFCGDCEDSLRFWRFLHDFEYYALENGLMMFPYWSTGYHVDECDFVTTCLAENPDFWKAFVIADCIP